MEADRFVCNGRAAGSDLGQPTAWNYAPQGAGSGGFNGPVSIAVDSRNGNLYVADFGNNRVLRIPAPFSNPAGTAPDNVYGQPDLNTVKPNSSGISDQSLKGPGGVAFDGSGNLWVADNGNNRLLRFPSAVLDTNNAAADIVLGQTGFTVGVKDSGGKVSATGFDFAYPGAVPIGMAFDAAGMLYASDFNNARVLKFAPPFTSGEAATAVIGQTGFTQ